MREDTGKFFKGGLPRPPPGKRYWDQHNKLREQRKQRQQKQKN